VTTKTATPSIKDLFSNPGVLAAIATPIVGVLAGQADRALDRMRQTRERKQGFTSMMDMHPDLRETKHPEFVANVYNSLARANPYIATDPFVAGSMIKNIVRSHEHINPQEATGYFLESFDRATGQRGQLNPRGDGPGPISSFTQGMRRISIGISARPECRPPGTRRRPSGRCTSTRRCSATRALVREKPPRAPRPWPPSSRASRASSSRKMRRRARRRTPARRWPCASS
jgi:hypothetical protein